MGLEKKAKTIHEKVTEALATIENLRYEKAHGDLDQSFPILTMELHNLIIEIEKDAQQEINAYAIRLDAVQFALDKATESFERSEREHGEYKQKLRQFPKPPNDNSEKILFIQWATDIGDWLSNFEELLKEAEP